MTLQSFLMYVSLWRANIPLAKEAKERVTTHIAETSCKQSCCTVEGSSIRAIGMGNATKQSILVAKGQKKLTQSRLAVIGGKKSPRQEYEMSEGSEWYQIDPKLLEGKIPLAELRKESQLTLQKIRGARNTGWG